MARYILNLNQKEKRILKILNLQVRRDKMLSKNQILSILEEQGDTLKNYGVSRIGLFGSYLHGDSKEKSDIDLLIEFSNKTYKTFSNYMKLKFYLEDLFGCKVDLIPKESLKPELQPVIMEEVEYAEL